MPFGDAGRGCRSGMPVGDAGLGCRSGMPVEDAGQSELLRSQCINVKLKIKKMNNNSHT